MPGMYYVQLYVVPPLSWQHKRMGHRTSARGLHMCTTGVHRLLAFQSSTHVHPYANRLPEPWNVFNLLLKIPPSNI
jgi:hypothetical protein